MTTHKNGFTIIELIIVIAIIAILTAVAVPIYTNVEDVSKSKADTATVEILNQVTVAYGMESDAESSDIFTGISDDASRIQKLVDEKYLTKAVSAQQKDAEFIWSVDSQAWLLIKIE